MMNNNDEYVKPPLISFDTDKTEKLTCDVLIIGSGIAGMSAAITAAMDEKSVVLCSKSDLSNTKFAQGGIASVIDFKNDSYQKHINDTVSVGLRCDEKIVSGVVHAGNDAISFLEECGCNFDKKNAEEYSLTKEGGHTANRVLHADGDATGQEIIEKLLRKVASFPNIKSINAFALDLLKENDSVIGSLVMRGDKLCSIFAGNTILATGGCGRVYRETSNPKPATGDGIAMAHRAGAKTNDMEFMQFHPTTLYIAGVPRHLITEAMRGEGAILRNNNGEQFMKRYDDRLELAPRDVVSRAIVNEISKTDFPHVWLDITHLPADFVKSRFPNIRKTCEKLSIDITKSWIPVHPSAHYICGGVKADINGKTNLENLYAIGEVACTGLHGANRLASNSLLEGVVLGINAGKAPSSEPKKTRVVVEKKFDKSINLDVFDLTESLTSILWRNAGIVKDNKQLLVAKRTIDFWQNHQTKGSFKTKEGWVFQNMLTTAELIINAAINRDENIGTHFKTS